MSNLIIDFPDCGELGSRENEGRDGVHDTITIMTDGCAPVIEAPAPLIEWWAWLLGALLIAGFIVATAIVRYRAHERKEVERKAELQAQVELAKAHKKCEFCGGVYAPATKGDKR